MDPKDVDTPRAPKVDTSEKETGTWVMEAAALGVDRDLPPVTPQCKKKKPIRKESQRRSFPSLDPYFFLTKEGRSAKFFTEVNGFEWRPDTRYILVPAFNKTCYCSNSKVTVVFGFYIVTRQELMPYGPCRRPTRYL